MDILFHAFLNTDIGLIVFGVVLTLALIIEFFSHKPKT